MVDFEKKMWLCMRAKAKNQTKKVKIDFVFFSQFGRKLYKTAK